MSEKAQGRESESAMERERDLPEGWAETTLKEIHIDQSSSVNPAKKPGQKFELYSVPSWDTAEPEILEGKGIGSSKLRVHSNVLLLCKINPRINRVWIVGDHSPWPKIASTEWIPFYPVEKIYQPYLAYYMQQNDFRDFLSMHASGVGGSLMRIKPSTFSDYPLLLAPLPEQHRIVEAIETQFTRLDAAVAALERARANLKRYRASVLQAACEGRLVPTEAELARERGRAYEPADALLARILDERRARWEEERWAYEIERAKKKAAQAERKAAGLPHYIRDLPEDSWIDRTSEEYEPYLPKSDKWKQKYDEPQPPDTERVSDLPKGWVWASVEQVSEKIVDCLHSTPEFRDTGFMCVDTNSMKPGRLVYEKIRYVNEETFHERNRRMKPETGDVLFSREGALLGIAVEVPTDIEICLGQRVMVFRLGSGVDSTYYETVLNSLTFSSQYRELITGTASPHLNIRDIRKLAVPLPPLAEQRRIVEEVERRLSVVEALEQAVEANLRRAERLRQAILKKAFEGRLVPQNPDDEPASALLARIHIEHRRGDDRLDDRRGDPRGRPNGADTRPRADTRPAPTGEC